MQKILKKLQKLIELMHEFNELAGYKINIQNQFYFYMLAMNNPKIKLSKKFYLQYI